MKKLKILIPSLIAMASMPLISLVGCGGDEEESKSSLSWDFVAEDGYQSQVKQKTVTSAYKQDEACKQYLKDAKENPLIFLDDLMLMDNVLYQTLHLSIGNYLSQYYVEIKDLSIDADKCYVSMNYICHIKVDGGTFDPMKTDVDIVYKNIPFVSIYQLNGIDKYNTSMWCFAPQYGFSLQSPAKLVKYFSALEHDWSIKGTFFSNLITNGEEAEIIEINLDKDHCSVEDITSDVNDALTESTNVIISWYFDNIPVAGDYDLVYDPANKYMHLSEPISLSNNTTKYFTVDLSKYQPEIKANIKIKFLEDSTATTTVTFIGKFGDTFYNDRDFESVDSSLVKQIALTKSDKIILGINYILDNFDLQISFFGSE